MLSLKQDNTKGIVIFFLLLLLMVPALLPLFHKGFFVSDDGEWMIIRLSAFYESFRDGQIPTRLLQRLNQGYGYPVANFLYPGFLYLGAPVHLLGFSFIDTIKVLLGASIIGSSYLMYLWLRKFFDEVSSIVGGVVYGYLPYRLFDIYKRGSVGEMLAFTVLPFVLWQLERKSVFWVSLGIGMLLLSHNTLATFFLGFLLLYIALDLAVVKERRMASVFYIKTLLLGLGVAAFFWIPAIFDLRYTVFSETSISNWNEYFSDIWLVGLESYLVFIATLLIFFLQRVKANKHRITLLMLFVGLLATFFASPTSDIFWRILPVSFVQFPFRFLAITTVSVAFLAAFVFSVSNKTERVIAGVILTIVLSFSVWSRVFQIHYIDKPDSFYSTNLDTTTVHGEYMPKYVKQIPTSWSREKVVTSQGTVESVALSNNTISFVTNSNNSAIYTVQKVFFPGWVARVDEKNASVRNDSNGLITVSVPSGRHVVKVFYTETPLHLVSDFVSIISVLILILTSIFSNRKGSRR